MPAAWVSDRFQDSTVNANLSCRCLQPVLTHTVSRQPKIVPGWPRSGGKAGWGLRGAQDQTWCRQGKSSDRVVGLPKCPCICGARLPGCGRKFSEEIQASHQVLSWERHAAMRESFLSRKMDETVFGGGSGLPDAHFATHAFGLL